MYIVVRARETAIVVHGSEILNKKVKGSRGQRRKAGLKLAAKWLRDMRDVLRKARR